MFLTDGFADNFTFPPYGMPTLDLHKLVQRGDLALVKELLSKPSPELDINAYNDLGLTPLMLAVKKAEAGTELVSLLLENGAEIEKETSRAASPTTAIRLSLGAGDPRIVGLLIRRGGNIHYRTSKGYTAAVDACHGRDISSDEKLLELLSLLIANRVDLSVITEYGESGLRVLSRLGRFDAVKVLLDAGADYSQLKWNSLHRAVALGNLGDVRLEAKNPDLLEERDWWGRTPWLLAVDTGDISKARCLHDLGANAAARGRCDKSSLVYAIRGHHSPMLDWLIEIGADIEAVDEFGTTLLIEAAENDNLPAVERLLQKGVNLESECHGDTALGHASSPLVAWRFLKAGANPSYITSEARRALLGLEPHPNPELFDLTKD